MRIDSTVVEADVKYRRRRAGGLGQMLAREGRKLAKLLNEKEARARDRPRAMIRKLRAISRTDSPALREAKKRR